MDQAPLIDTFGRVHDNLRISVTDRCNIRCFYCMPEEGIQFQPREEILSFEEIARFARVAAGLGVARLGGSPVAVPVAELTGTIGRARAHLYAAFHSGRTQTDLLTGERRGRGPISRETLCKLSGAAANSQRNYERRARVGRRKAIAIGPAVSAADAQETAWERGRALFRYHDRRGRHGRPGAVYLAWQLPNEYTGPHDTMSRGSVKRLNRSLSDLFHNGITGNGEGNYELGITNYQLGGGAVGSGQWTVNSRSVGQSSVVGGRSAVARQYYNSAKGAHGARRAGERYWRHGGVWLWQPEIRDTKYEIRVQASDERRTCSSFVIRKFVERQES